MIVISSINCYLESIELINIIIEGKLNYAHNHIGLCGIIAEGAVSGMEWGVSVERGLWVRKRL